MASAPGTGQAFDSDGVRIAYDDVGSGPPVVLVHGFASDRRTDWLQTGWYDALVGAGRRVIALDCRGHGESGKPRDPGAYGPDIMAADVVRLLDHLSVPAADVVGYSMGGLVAVRLLVDHPDSVNAVVLGGLGASVVRRVPNQEAIAAALEADDRSGVSHPVGRRFRTVAERADADLQALALAIRAIPPFELSRLADVTEPVLVVAGAEDSLADDPRALVDVIPGASAFVVPDRGHATTVGDPRFVEAVIDFLGEQSP